MRNTFLGLGLLSIGRSWGVRNVPAPSQSDAVNVILTAYDAGIRFFDTAPAYRHSEKILGMALSDAKFIRGTAIIATKAGEHWDFQAERSYTDHRYDALKRSFDESLEHLGSIDVIQIHKANADNVVSKHTERFIEYVVNCGVQNIGASVSDIETAKVVCHCGMYTYIQFPYNAQNPYMEIVFDWLERCAIRPIINRPFAMGGLLSDTMSCSKEAAFDFILKRNFDGIVLTGTSSVNHLLDNVKAFRKSLAKCG